MARKVDRPSITLEEGEFLGNYTVYTEDERISRIEITTNKGQRLEAGQSAAKPALTTELFEDQVILSILGTLGATEVRSFQAQYLDLRAVPPKVRADYLGIEYITPEM